MAACGDPCQGHGTVGNPHELELECQICGTGVSRQAVQDCPGCHALFYCSAKHRQRAFFMGHGEECAAMAAQMDRTEEMRDFPFSFRQEATAEVDSLSATICTFLHKRGCHGRGAWRRECPCGGPDAAPWGHLAAPLPPAPATLPPGLEALWALPPASRPCLRSQMRASCQVRDWASYYQHRGLPLDSPAVLLLHAPLTVWLGIGSGAERYPDLISLAPGSRVTCYLLGAQKEVDQWPVFLELGCLLPHLHLHLIFIGPDVPDAMHRGSAMILSPMGFTCGEAGCSCVAAAGAAGGGGDDAAAGVQGSVRLSFWQGLYHEVCEELQAVHGAAQLVFGLNAGLAIYPTWGPTLARLLEPGAPPCLFTDYCEMAAVKASEAVAAVTGTQGAAQQAPARMAVNPFRRPFSGRGLDNALPSYSNGFFVVCQ